MFGLPWRTPGDSLSFWRVDRAAEAAVVAVNTAPFRLVSETILSLKERKGGLRIKHEY